MLVVSPTEEFNARMGCADTEYFLEQGNYGFRQYDHDRDEEDVCRLCWNNALPGGRPFTLIPEAGAISFGRIVTGPFAKYEPDYFYVVDELSSGSLVGYLTGAKGSPKKTKKGKIPWMRRRDKAAKQIAENEFGKLSYKLCMPVHGLLVGSKFVYALSLGTRAVQFLLHAKSHGADEMPDAPGCPEFHYHVAKNHRGKGIGSKLIAHFVSQFRAKKYHEICAQVTVCEGQKPLSYYTQMSYRGKKIWKVFDKKETAMYTDAEKQEWGLGDVVENASLIADKKTLLAFVRQQK